MKQTFILLILTLFSFNANSQCASNSNVYTFTWSGKTYEVVKEMKTWSAAAACAVERGGYLVEINDQNEQNAVYDAITKGAGVSPTYTVVQQGGGIAYVWIGATDQLKEGEWLWDGNNDAMGTNFWNGQGKNGTGNGSAVSNAYHNWGGKSKGIPNEPDNFNLSQHHGAIGLANWPSGSGSLGSAAEWNDIPGTSLLYFVIEKNSTTGLNEPRKERLDIFPNPSTGLIWLRKTYHSVEAFDMTGCKSFQKYNCSDVDLGGLKKGVYLLKLNDDLSQKTVKIVLK
jgi:hypothetical protein